MSHIVESPFPPTADTVAAATTALSSETELIAAATALAGHNGNFSAAERRLYRGLPNVQTSILSALHAEITTGRDPLGDAFCQIRPPNSRRRFGATYTPLDIVASMTAWAAAQDIEPARIVDPGAGSGRFLSAAAPLFPHSQLIAVETDPVAALTLRATANVRGFADRLTVKLNDYRRIHLPRSDGPTLFIGNPPYVRHHNIGQHWKDWYARAAARRGLKASKLAGLHLHFFFKTMMLAREGDFGTFITAAEWLDVNYGHALRQLLAGDLGATALHVLDPTLAAFPDAAATSAITCFHVGQQHQNLRVRAVTTHKALNNLSPGRAIPLTDVRKTPRWSSIVYPCPKPPRGHIELGELFRVHRGQVTGANNVWIAGNHAAELPDQYLYPTVTRARELIAAGNVLDNAASLRRVIDLPADLDQLPCDAQTAIADFLAWARTQHAHRGYIARHRRSWWSVGLREPAPLVCTYMARRPPAFVHNKCDARLLNIAHGLYPRVPIPEELLAALVGWLKANVRTDDGRTYAGGLTKFEPGEVERISIPAPQYFHA